MTQRVSYLKGRSVLAPADLDPVDDDGMKMNWIFSPISETKPLAGLTACP